MTERRTFLKETLALAAMAIAAKQTQSVQAATGATTKPLRILVLGGTGFIGPYHVRYAVQRGHHVSVFNRGIRQADLPNEVEHLQGDRNGDLKSIMGRDWDAVLDLPTILPGSLLPFRRKRADCLNNECKQMSAAWRRSNYFQYSCCL